MKQFNNILNTKLGHWVKHVYKRLSYKAETAVLPNYATILVDTRCTNACLFCVNHNPAAKYYNLTNPIYIKKHFSLGLDDYCKQVDILLNAGIKNIHLCGAGEPFLNNNMLSFMDYLNEKGETVSFQTNFQASFMKHLPEVVIRNIKYIGTDIVGGTKSSFEYIKQGTKWETFWSRLDQFYEICEQKQIFIPLHIYTVINRQRFSWEKLDELIHRCSRYPFIQKIVLHNIHAFNFNEFVSENNIITNNDIEIITYINQVKQLAKSYHIELIPPAYLNPSIRFNCWNFWGRIMLNFPNDKIPQDKWNGNVMPGGCLAATLGNFNSIGNIYDTPFNEIWNSEKMKSARAASLTNAFPDPYCKICPAHDTLWS